MSTNTPIICSLFAVSFLVCGCESSTPPFALSEPSAATASSEPSEPSIRDLSDERELVKELLEIDACIYEFSGTLLSVWVEAETKIEGEADVVRTIGPVSVSQSTIENGAPESVVGKIIFIAEDFSKNPKLRLVYESESKKGSSGMELSQDLESPWPDDVRSWMGPTYRFLCPSTVPEQGQEFAIASITKTTKGATKTITIKGKRLHGAPDPLPEEKTAVNSLRNARASVYLQGFTYDFGEYQGDPNTFAKKVRFPYLEENLSNETVRQLGQLAELEILELGFTPMTDEQLVHLEGLSNLVELSLGRKVTPAGLKHLSNLTNLRELHVGTRYSASFPDTAPSTVGDTDLQHLADLTKLEVLSLHFEDAKLTDSAIEHITKLTRLRELSLEYADFTDAELEQLSGLIDLEILVLRGTKLTDAGLEKLQGLKKLKRLEFTDGGVTDEGLEEFKTALPGCRLSKR